MRRQSLVYGGQIYLLERQHFANVSQVYARLTRLLTKTGRMISGGLLLNLGPQTGKYSGCLWTDSSCFYHHFCEG